MTAEGGSSGRGAIRLEGVSKRFSDGTEAVGGVELDVREGELLVLVGPSGSGKSTLLRTVAGLDAPTEGRILIDGEDVTDLEPGQRDLAMVFQSYALYPHKTVRDNLAFGLRMRNRAPAEIREKVDAVADMLGIRALLDRKPAQLSGGERQRVALGRAIVRTPRAFLLDEPLSNLDPALRHRTRTELARLHRRLRTTMLYVTHDQEEAMTLGDRVAVLRGGRLEQVAPPMELYHRPLTRFVASFIGSPAMNLLRCRVRAGGGATREGGGRAHARATGARVQIEGEGVDLRLDPGALPRSAHAGAEVDLGVRPHDLRPAASPEAADFHGVVDLVEPRGSEVVVRLRGGETAAGTAFTFVLPPETSVREGDTVALTVRRERLHFFDVGSGRRLE